MKAVTRTLGQALAAAAVAVALLLGGIHVQGADAAPVKDERTLPAKIKAFRQDCETFGGTATDRPSAMDADKAIVNCKGGDLGGNGCVYTSTTSDCGPTREQPDAGVPGSVDGADIGPSDTQVLGVDGVTTPDASPRLTASTDDQEQDTGRSNKTKKGKKDGKGRKK